MNELGVIERWAAWAERRLRARHPPPPIGLDALLPSLRQRLRALAERVLLLEVNVARLRGELAGEDRERRYQDFLRRLDRPPERKRLWREYPRLRESCARLAADWVSAAGDFLTALQADRAVLESELEVRGEVTAVRAGGGDWHRGGRGQWHVTFAGGQQLIYKPRSLAVDQHFAALICWLNGYGQQPPLRAARAVDRGEHGWVEWIAAAPCRDDIEIDAFYRRQGGWLALLYVLGGTDLHHENLVAAGEHPVLVDLEALFHPLVEEMPISADRPARMALADSVMAVGLLPAPFGAERSVDLSGLGARAGDTTPFEVDAVRDAGTDEACVTKVPARLLSAHHAPTLNGAPIDFRRFASALESGFRETYRRLTVLRDELLSPFGPLTPFLDAPTRVIVRPTAFYISLLRDAHHPQQLRAASDPERVWSRLDQSPALARFAADERCQLAIGDIPYFETCPASHDVRGSGGRVIAGALARTGWAIARARLQRLGDDDLARQTELLRASLAAAGAVVLTAARPRGDSPLELAHAIGRRLMETAVRDPETASWIALAPSADGGYRLGVTGPDLYDGLPGISLFLAYLAAETGDKAMRRLAEQAWRTAESLPPAGIGAFSGVAGRIYAAAHLGYLWHREELVDGAEHDLAAVAEGIDHDEKLDIIAGLAGAIPALLALDAVRPQSLARALAYRAGDRLLEIAVPQGARLSWPSLPLARGLSHGTSGIAWALSTLGLPRFTAAASAAAAYERGLLVESWTDRHRHGDEPQATWCHGAPGVALSRLAMFRATGDLLLRDDARRAMVAMESATAPRTQCLCHGLLGNLEVWQLAAETWPGDKRWAALRDQRRAAVIDDIRRHGFRCALPQGTEGPGLMTGLSGIGLGLLRLSAPERVPSVLRLQGPQCGGAFL